MARVGNLESENGEGCTKSRRLLLCVEEGNKLNSCCNAQKKVNRGVQNK
jgi:hypothetical protein